MAAMYIGLLIHRTEKTIGSGESGNVYKAAWSISGTTKEVAVITIRVDRTPRLG